MAAASHILPYRDAEYDIDPGVSMTKRRVGTGAVDMQRARGRDNIGECDDALADRDSGDGGQVYSEGETGGKCGQGLEQGRTGG